VRSLWEILPACRRKTKIVEYTTVLRYVLRRERDGREVFQRTKRFESSKRTFDLHAERILKQLKKKNLSFPLFILCSKH
jgi:hypothetical protein